MPSTPCCFGRIASAWRLALHVLDEGPRPTADRAE
jgi:hypothetical protein